MKTAKKRYIMNTTTLTYELDAFWMASMSKSPKSERVSVSTVPPASEPTVGATHLQTWHSLVHPRGHDVLAKQPPPLTPVSSTETAIISPKRSVDVRSLAGLGS